MDWISFGLPTEGKKAKVLRVANVMRTDIPTCALIERIGDVRTATQAAGWEVCAVVNDERIVLGILYGDAWNASAESLVEDVMSNGPPTTRPNTFIDEMVERMRRRNTPGILITSSDGALMGYLWKSDAETALETGNCAHTWTDRDCSPSEVE
jgi:CBS domain-containing protein